MAGQQRPDLSLARRVVQHDQDSLVRQQVAEHRRAIGGAARDVQPGNPEITQEPAEHHARLGHLIARAGQIDEQLTVHIGLGEPVCRLHREGGLADARLPGHRDHRQRGVLAAGDRAGHRVQFGAASRVMHHLGRQLPWDENARRGGGQRGHHDLVAHDPRGELAQCLTRLDAQFVGEGPVQVAVGGQRVRPAAGADQGEQVELVQPLAVRVLGE